jgi:hypothetical protein
MTRFQRLVAFYKVYAKAVNTHLTAIGAWLVYMINANHWPPTHQQWALLIMLVFPGLAAAVTTNVPRQLAGLGEPVFGGGTLVQAEPLVPAFSSKVAEVAVPDPGGD